MAFEMGPSIIVTYPAGADLSAKQYYHVKFSSGQIVACTGVTDKPLGILQNKPDAAGKPAEVLMFGISKINSDAALSQDDFIGTSADGQAAAYVAGTDTTKYITGRVLQASTAAAAYATAAIDCMHLNRAA